MTIASARANEATSVALTPKSALESNRVTPSAATRPRPATAAAILDLFGKDSWRSSTTSAMSRHTFSVQAAGAGSHKPKSRRRRPSRQLQHAVSTGCCHAAVPLGDAVSLPLDSQERPGGRHGRAVGADVPRARAGRRPRSSGAVKILEYKAMEPFFVAGDSDAP